jgi:hypothetical protein
VEWGAGGVACARVGERLLRGDRHQGVHLRIEPLDALEAEFDELDGTGLALADEPCLLDGGHERKLVARAGVAAVAQIQSKVSWRYGTRK